MYDRLPGPDCWNDIPGGKKAGETLIMQGHDIIFTAEGGTGIGTFQAVDEVEGVYESRLAFFAAGNSSSNDINTIILVTKGLVLPLADLW